MKRLLLLLIAIIAISTQGWAQGSTGEIQGRVINEKGEGIPFANVVVYLNETQVNGAATDFNGYFSIKPLDPGTYKVVVSYLDKKANITNVAVSPSKTTFLDDVQLNMSAATQLQAVDITYKRPPVDEGKPETSTTISREQIAKMPRNDLVGILGNAAATYQSDDGNLPSIAGARGYGTKYIVDGVDLTGIVDLPVDAIDQVSVITSGVDASQGDFTGGVISVSTRGPSNEYNGSAEYFTSQYLDPYGYNEARISLLGPLVKKYKGTDSARSMVGFLFSGLYRYQKDSDPPAIDMYVVEDDVLAQLKENPLRTSSIGEGLVKSTEFVTFDDMRTTPFKLNNDQHEVNLYGKIDIKPSLYTNLTIGSSYYYSDRNAYIRTFHMFNSENNPKVYDNDIRVYAKFRQNFVTGNKSEKEAKGYTLDNAYYTIIVDYQRVKQWVEDRNHGRNPFRYGYIGSFDIDQAPVYAYSEDSVTGYSGYRLIGYQDTSVTFQPGNANPILSEYTSTYFSQADPFTLDQVILGGGLRNGDFFQNLFSYSMWYNPGVPYTSYQETLNNQYGGRFDASFDLKKSTEDKVNRHNIQFGFEYQQRVESRYSVGPFGIWTLARQLTNRHISGLDFSNPYFVQNGQRIYYQNLQSPPGEFDTIYYNRLYQQSEQAQFDANLRRKLGLPVDGLDIINVDAINPDQLSLDMFSPDELLNAGNRYVTAIGYDYNGNLFNQQPTFADFFRNFDDKNGNGVQDFGEPFTREMAAYRPIYTAAYIQDRFNIGRVIFRVGLRVDRFDANTQVLRDKYSLYGIRSASEVSEINGTAVDHPANIGDDYAVYVDDVQNPTRIVGYRTEDTWFDAGGNELQDPEVLVNQTGGSGQIAPFLEDPTQDIKSPNFNVESSFKDYEPQITAMPRIAFSFPITETAMFTAHYDVLTQRPLGNNEATPYHYYFLQEIAIDGVIPNPNLRPERTINYQLGFQQALSEDSRLAISAFYREMRDMMQVQRLNFAYPIEYTTYGNVDFGTVKGLTLSYDLIRRVKNMLINANYTLQFADGTGSNSTSQLNLVSAGQPNLRTIVPLDQDVRHTFNVNLDYRFMPGDAYNGPMVGGKPILENFGINLAFRGRTGEPYTRQANPTQTAQFGVASRSRLEGTINGSRLPFNYKLDLRIDKDFLLSTKGDRKLYLNVYVVSQNVLNTRNIINVYGFTGSPTDDGYLASAQAEEVLQAQLVRQAFIDQYLAKVQNPSNYSLPRRIQVGAKLRF